MSANKFGLSCLLLIVALSSMAQKKPLDHSVYDGWQHIGERMISNDGKWIFYTIDPQQGDNELIIQSADAKNKINVPRGYDAKITEDNRYVVFKIKPFYKDTREAKIKKKKPADFPKDSLGILELGQSAIWKRANLKNYKTPKESSGWLAYQVEADKDAGTRKKSEAAKPENTFKKTADSLELIIDSLQAVIQNFPKKKKQKDDVEQYDDADGDGTTASGGDTGADLVLRNLTNGEEKTFNHVLEYYFSNKNNKLLMDVAKDPKDSNSVAKVVLYDCPSGKTVWLSKQGNDFKNFVMTDDGDQLAYVAERDAAPKDLQKFYKLWYFKEGMDSATLLVDKFSVGMQLGMTVSEFANLSFSKSGKRLFFGTAPIQAARDTTLVDFEHAKLDIWHYKDDYLQTVQTTPLRLRAAQQENFLAVYDINNKEIKQLGTKDIPIVIPTNEGDGDNFIGVSDVGKRIESQWMGTTKKDIYTIAPASGDKKLVKKDLFGQLYPSSTGKYILWYDRQAKNYFVWDGQSV
ncbi:MAG TPA: S9 family peptidase, partial [Chitinophagaceae bacterium]|nr:S9 family peptidase [Chitinophagaceae bacterium]